MAPQMLNPLLIGTDIPPIPAAQDWADRYDGRYGPLINLAQAVPGTPPPPDMLARLAAAAGDPSTSAYGPIIGDLALREALAAEIGRIYGGDVRPHEIAITPGCNHAFLVAAMALARAGDEIILPTPWYFNHKMTLDMLGIGARPLPCLEQHGFVPQVENARALLGPRTRAILLVSPNNPTGAVYPAPILTGFADLCGEAGITLVLDETYRDFLPEGMARPHGILARPHWRDVLVQLYSFSKSYAIPGHRLGAMLASAARMAEIAKVLDCSQICAPRAAQAAVAWGIEGIADWRRATRAGVNRQADLFREVVGQAPGWSIAAIGAYFAYVRHPFGTPGEVVAERLAAEAGVLALPGSFFGPGQDRHLRFAFANVAAERLAEVSRRLAMLS